MTEGCLWASRGGEPRVGVNKTERRDRERGEKGGKKGEKGRRPRRAPKRQQGHARREVSSKKELFEQRREPTCKMGRLTRPLLSACSLFGSALVFFRGDYYLYIFFPRGRPGERGKEKKNEGG